MKRLVCFSLLFFLLLVPGWAIAEKPSVIHVGHVIDLSGPYASTDGPYKSSILDAWNYINTTMGGVKGVKVVPITRDTSGKIPLGLSFYNELINIKPKPIFFYASESPLGEALRERYKEDGVLSMGAGTLGVLYPAGNVFGIHPLYPEHVAVAMKWVKDNWKEKRNPRVGIITWDTAFGRSILIDEFFAYAKSIGVDIVGTQLFGVREVDVTTHMMKLRMENPDWLMTNTLGGGPLAIKKSAKEMGWNIRLLHGPWAGEWGTVKLSPGDFEGDVVALSYKSLDEENDPSIKKIMEHFTRNKRDINDRTLFYPMGWGDVLLTHHVMETTVTRHGWEGLNADNMKQVLINLKDFKPLGELTSFTYSEKRRTPTKARVYIIKGGKLLPLTDFMEVPDLRPAMYK